MIKKRAISKEKLKSLSEAIVLIFARSDSRWHVNRYRISKYEVNGQQRIVFCIPDNKSSVSIAVADSAEAALLQAYATHPAATVLCADEQMKGCELQEFIGVGWTDALLDDIRVFEVEP